MDFGKLFRLEEAFADGAVRAKEEIDVVGDRNIELATGRWRPQAILHFKQYTGTKLCDFMGTQRAALRLVSDRVFDAFREARLSGWDALPVNLRARGGLPIAGYRLLIITGSCGPVDNTRSIRIEKLVSGNPQGHAQVWKGLYFDESTWDGSDVFAPVGTASAFATVRVKDVLEHIGATNFYITSLSDFERVSLI